MTSINRFLKHVIPEPNSGCWLWTGALGGGEYASFWDNKAMKMATGTRWILLETGTQITENQIVCHKCDNPICVNPHHLFLSDHSGNAMDSVAKGRSHGRAKDNKCKNGHALESGSFMVKVTRGKPWRKCLKCLHSKHSPS